MATQRPIILITNDDGIEAPGILALWRALSNLPLDLVVVAPQVNQSGKSLALTLHDPLRVNQVSWHDGTPAWSVNGTPADCVKLALHDLVPRTPSLVVSGINWGSNAGRSLWYSGTVGAAIEAVIGGVPAVAFSCEFEKRPPSFEVAEAYAPAIIRYALEHVLPPGTLLNVNFPPVGIPFKGLRWAQQGRRYWKESPEKRHNPQGSPYYWTGMRPSDCVERSPESDISLLQEGYATVVPLHVDNITDHDHYELHRSIFDQFIQEAVVPPEDR